MDFSLWCLCAGLVLALLGVYCFRRALTEKPLSLRTRLVLLIVLTMAHFTLEYALTAFAFGFGEGAGLYPHLVPIALVFRVLASLALLPVALPILSAPLRLDLPPALVPALYFFNSLLAIGGVVWLVIKKQAERR